MAGGDLSREVGELQSTVRGLTRSLEKHETSVDKRLKALDDRFDDYVTKESFNPIQKAVYAFFGFVALAFMTVVAKVSGYIK